MNDTKPYHDDDLKNAGVAFGILQKLKEAYMLDESQHVLSGMIRHGANWRLRERALEYAADIKKPTNEFLEAICCVVTDDGIYINARILAAEALKILVPIKMRQTKTCPTFRGVSVQRMLQNILEFPQELLFYDAVTKALEAINLEHPAN